MSHEDGSATFDGRIAAALAIGPLLPLALYVHAPALLLPTLLAATVAQLMLPFSRHTSRRRVVVVAGLLGIFGIGWPLYLVGGIAGA